MLSTTCKKVGLNPELIVGFEWMCGYEQERKRVERRSAYVSVC